MNLCVQYSTCKLLNDLTFRSETSSLERSDSNECPTMNLCDQLFWDISEESVRQGQQLRDNRQTADR